MTDRVLLMAAAFAIGPGRAAHRIAVCGASRWHHGLLSRVSVEAWGRVLGQSWSMVWTLFGFPVVDPSCGTQTGQLSRMKPACQNIHSYLLVVVKWRRISSRSAPETVGAIRSTSAITDATTAPYSGAAYAEIHRW